MFREVGFSFGPRLSGLGPQCLEFIPIGSRVVPFYGSYLESYKVIPKRNYLGAYG